MDKFLKGFVKSYIHTALWSSTDTVTDADGYETYPPLDNLVDNGEASLSYSMVKSCILDCITFINRVKATFGEEQGKEILERPAQDLEYLAPHDFWLTRCGHGAGFWDGDWEDYDEDGKQLTAISVEMGKVDLYLGDENKIYTA